MRGLIIAYVLALTVVAGLGRAEANGRLKGAAVGGRAGHMVGHGVPGAAASCAIGHHRANRDTTINTATTSTGSAATITTTSRLY